MIEGYKRHDNGLIEQLNPSEYVYDPKYVKDRYDSYGPKCDMMSYLRLGYILGTLDCKPNRVLDIGYGNGSFLKACKEADMNTFGTDVSGYELEPHGTFLTFDEIFKYPFDLITMFDSLEHFTKISFVKKLRCKYIAFELANRIDQVVEPKIERAGKTMKIIHESIRRGALHVMRDYIIKGYHG